MIILGIILLIAGFLLKISILWTIGIILLVIGVDPGHRGIHRARRRRPPALLLTFLNQLPAGQAYGPPQKLTVL